MRSLNVPLLTNDSSLREARQRNAHRASNEVTTTSWDSAPVFSFEDGPQLSDAKALDLFLSQLYFYVISGGVVNVIISHVVHILALLLTSILCWLLLCAINWNLVFNECSNVSPEFKCSWSDILSGTTNASRSSGVLATLWNQQVSLFLIVLGAFLFWSISIAYVDCCSARSIRRFIESLGIKSDEDLSSLDWTELMSLVLLKQTRSSTFHLTAADIVNAILRYENYMVSLVSHQVFVLPPWLPQRLLYTRHCLGNIKMALFSHLFDSKAHLNSELIDNPITLSRRFRWLGLLNLVLLGPTLLASILISFFKHAQSVRYDLNKLNVQRRTLNSYSQWMFRNYNELQHQLDQRMLSASLAISSYLRMTARGRSEGKPLGTVWSSSCRFIQYALAAFLSILLAVAFIDDRPLLNIQIFNKHLLWYSLIAGGILTFMRSFDSEDDSVSSKALADTFPMTKLKVFYIAKVFQYLQCVPSRWRALVQFSDDSTSTARLESETLAHIIQQRTKENCLQREILKEFYSSPVVQCCEEIFGILMTPIVLGFYLPLLSNCICTFIKSNTCRTPHLGDICAFSNLERIDLNFHQRDLGRQTVSLHNIKAAKSAISFAVSCRCNKPFQQAPEVYGIPKNISQILQAIEEFQITTLIQSPHLMNQLEPHLTLPLHQTHSTVLNSGILASYTFWFDEMLGSNHSSS